MASDRTERRLAAIMFTDIVGYTALMAESEAKGLRVRARHRGLVRPLVEKYHGESIEARGDESLSTFPTALDAVNCALAIEEALAGDPDLKLHLGIHLGDLVVQGGEVSGDGVNIASRICSLSQGGGLSVSAEVYRSIRNQPEIEATALGEQDLKNVPEPVAVYAVSGKAAPPRAISQAVLERPAAADESALKALTGRPDVAVFVVPAIWVVYVAIVFEILFMISPFALYYYSAYGPSLNFLHGSATTSWLTDFFLPHFSDTTSPLLNAIPAVGSVLLGTGVLFFTAGFAQLYWAKLRGSEAVVGGLYRWVRHPQYAALAVTGLGTLLVWPRLLVLITYVTMLFLYTFLARVEEEQCLKKYGDAYRAFMERTGMFLPGRLFRWLPRPSTGGGGRRSVAALGIYAAVVAVAIASAYGLRDWSLGHVSVLYRDNLAALSPAQLSLEELATALDIAQQHPEVRAAIQAGPDGPLLVYVVPVGWEIQDIPMHTERVHRAHHMPRDFDRRIYRVLFTRARVHDASIPGEEIVKRAYGRDPIIQVVVNSEAGEVTAVETPPGTVLWGDIPTPLF